MTDASQEGERRSSDSSQGTLTEDVARAMYDAWLIDDDEPRWEELRNRQHAYRAAANAALNVLRAKGVPTSALEHGHIVVCEASYMKFCHPGWHYVIVPDTASGSTTEQAKEGE